MSTDVVNKTLGTQVSSASFLGWQKATLITSKCFLKLFFALDYNQYCGYVTPRFSMIPWVKNQHHNFATRK
jgi:hypothetical protein